MYDFLIDSSSIILNFIVIFISELSNFEYIIVFSDVIKVLIIIIAESGYEGAAETAAILLGASPALIICA